MAGRGDLTEAWRDRGASQGRKWAASFGLVPLGLGRPTRRHRSLSLASPTPGTKDHRPCPRERGRDSSSSSDSGPFSVAPSVVSMSTLYVLSLRTEEDLVETDGYVPGGLAAGQAARTGGALVGSPGSEEPWRRSPPKGIALQALGLLEACKGGWAGLPGGGADISRSLPKPVCLVGPFSAPLGSWASESQRASRGPGWNGHGGTGGGQRATVGSWALIAHCHLSSWAISDSFFSLSSPAPIPPPVPLCCPLALLLCPLPVFWPCSGPSTLGGVRPGAHGTCLHRAPALLPLAPATLLPASFPPSLSTSSCPCCSAGTPRPPC